MPEAYGFVGVGEIASAVVEGLSAGVEDPPAVYLSPRGREVGRELAERFPNARVCDSNQDVLASATAIVLAVRPPLTHEVLEPLSFRSEHVLISAVAGVTLERLRDWAAHAGRIVRAIPLPSAAGAQSLTVTYPDDSVAHELFGRVGGVLVPRTEESLEAFSAATATFAAHLDYLTTITAWLAEQDVADEVATAYVAHVFGHHGQRLLQHSGSLDALRDQHMTPGGLNEQVLADLRRDGMPDAVRRALDRVLARLRG